jgi:hypothetical protein
MIYSLPGIAAVLVVGWFAVRRKVHAIAAERTTTQQYATEIE